MTKEMSFREAILDSLADGGESIVQIQEYLEYIGIIESIENVKHLIENLLDEGLIEIVYPPEKEADQFKVSNKSSIGEFWFELTEKGRSAWKKI